MRKYLASVAKISQMLPGPVDGTGQGGDRCEPTCAAMIDCTYQLGPSAKAGEAPEQVMEDIARWRNGGALSGPPEGAWLGDWVAQISNGAVSLQAIPSTPESVIAAISAGNMIYAGIDDYGAQRLEDGSDPYQWPETEHAGHVEIIAGYDDSAGFAPLLHDPLRGTNGMPAAYSWQSMLNAGLHLYRVAGPALPVEGGTTALDSNYQQTAPDNLHCPSTGFDVHGWICTNVLAAVNADKLSLVLGLPREANHEDADGRWRQRFDYAIASQHSQNEGDFRFEALPAPPPVDDSALKQEVASLQQQVQLATQSATTHADLANKLQAQLDTADAEIAALKAAPPVAVPPTSDLQQRLDEANAALASAQQELALLKAQEPTDPVALQQRQTSAIEALAQYVYCLIPAGERPKSS